MFKHLDKCTKNTKKMLCLTESWYYHYRSAVETVLHCFGLKKATAVLYSFFWDCQQCFLGLTGRNSDFCCAFCTLQKGSI